MVTVTVLILLTNLEVLVHLMFTWPVTATGPSRLVALALPLSSTPAPLPATRSWGWRCRRRCSHSVPTRRWSSPRYPCHPWSGRGELGGTGHRGARDAGTGDVHFGAPEQAIE